MQPKEEEKTVQRSLLKYNLLCTSTPWNISSKIVYKGYHIYAWSLQTILLNKNSRLPWDLNSDSWSRRRARWPFGQHRPGLNPVSIASLWLFLRCQNNWGRFQSGKEHSPASSMWHPSFRLDRMFALAKLGSNGHAKCGRFTDWIKIFLKWKVQGIFFKKIGLPGLFFKQTLQFLQQINVKKYSSSIRCRDLNPWPLEYEFPSITTRPGLPPCPMHLYINKSFLLFCQIYFKLGVSTSVYLLWVEMLDWDIVRVPHRWCKLDGQYFTCVTCCKNVLLYLPTYLLCFLVLVNMTY